MEVVGLFLKGYVVYFTMMSFILSVVGGLYCLGEKRSLFKSYSKKCFAFISDIKCEKFGSKFKYKLENEVGNDRISSEIKKKYKVGDRVEVFVNPETGDSLLFDEIYEDTSSFFLIISVLSFISLIVMFILKFI